MCLEVNVVIFLPSTFQTQESNDSDLEHSTFYSTFQSLDTMAHSHMNIPLVSRHFQHFVITNSTYKLDMIFWTLDQGLLFHSFLQ